MIAAGILAALIILLSPTFQRETSQFLSENKGPAEKSCKTETQVVAVSSDAVTSSQGAIENVTPFVIQEIITDEGRPSILTLSGITPLISFFSTFLRTVISPQAP